MELHGNPALNKKTQAKTPTSGNPEYEIRNILNELRSTIDDRNVEKLMTFYAPDVVAFDIVAPLQFVGKEAYKKSWVEAFEACKSQEAGLSEIHDLSITASADVAFVHSLNHNIMVDQGKKLDMWMRCTQCFEKINGHWLITHEQYSVPVDFETKQALFNLKPEDITPLH